MMGYVAHILLVCPGLNQLAGCGEGRVTPSEHKSKEEIVKRTENAGVDKLQL